jgi:exopolysaccharide biosynthesis polyprenyl glycosylphosphotransferase
MTVASSTDEKGWRSPGRRASDPRSPLAPVVPLRGEEPDASGLPGPGRLPDPLRRRERETRSPVTKALVPALLAGLAAAVLAGPAGTPVESGAVTFAVFGAATYLLRARTTHIRLLPFAARTMVVLPVLGAALLVLLVQSLSGLPDLGRLDMLAVTALAICASLLLAVRRRVPPQRAVVVGSRASAEMLARELAVAGVIGHEVVGVVAVGEVDDEFDEMPVLGQLSELATIVEGHRIDLLLMTGEAPRLAVFEELARSCLHLPVRLWELSGFYEEAFGHVPVAEINASWFQYIMHPKYQPGGGAAKRALDLFVGGIVGLFAVPVLALLALIVKIDGGPAFFRQQRIGEGGRQFTMLKLRSMQHGSDAGPQWAAEDDPRVTPVGRFLRRTHLDELPQILNVLRGDMSLVGPRPEQPAFVERLEGTIPFYSRRHLVKPGVTGWAQVRCGYAGSDTGSAWKLCHDLYYLKHRSLRLDLAIIVETFRTLVADPQYDVQPAGVAFILRPALAADDGVAL